MCNALVSFIVKATVSAPCEPCMSCRSVVLHYSSHVYVKLLFDKLTDWLIIIKSKNNNNYKQPINDNY